MPAETEKTRKAREKPTPYARKAREPHKKDAPKTAAKPAASGRQENLTLAHWVNVIKFIDDYPHLSQGEVVAHFKNQKDGALPFDQSTLSRKLKQRQALENASALIVW